MRKFALCLLVLIFTLVSVNTSYAATNTGWVKKGNVTYYYKSDGIMAKGWQTIQNNKYYFYSTGGMAIGWLKLSNNRTYYLGGYGVMVTGRQFIDGKTYVFASTGELVPTTGWSKEGAVTYYYEENGVKAKGWKTIDNQKYYFYSTGGMATNWLELHNKRYYLGSDGVMVAGWKKVGNTSYYFNNDGTMVKGWQTINNKKYYFFSTGGMAIGWLDLPNRKYYTGTDGVVVTGQQNIGGRVYVFSPTGELVSSSNTNGWVDYQGNTYYYVDGNKMTGFQTINNKRYYFDSNGAMIKSNTTVNGKKYTFFADGSIKSETSYTNYSKTIDDMVNINLSLNPPGQTDAYRNDPAYVYKDYVTVNPADSTKGTVNVSSLNVRDGAGTDYRIVGGLSNGQTVKILSTVGDWYQITFGTWRNAKPEDLKYYLDPNNFKENTSSNFQFLNLSQNTGILASELNSKILYNKGIFAGKGQAFIDASKQYGVNELYLISHAFLETGNGKSSMATGILVSSVDGKPVEPKTVYNMYGIHAFDSCPIQCGSEYAYQQGWFTPEAAIIGGAQFIGETYIHNPNYLQDTLYKMRWNPTKPGLHQYATDIGWAAKQVSNLYNMYQLLDYYTLYFNVPVYNN